MRRSQASDLPKHRTAAATEKEPCSLSPEALGASEYSLRVQVHGDLDLGDLDLGDPDLGDPDPGDPDLGDLDLGDPDPGDPDLGDPDLGDPGMGQVRGADRGMDLGGPGMALDREGPDMGLDLGAVMGMAVLKTRNKTIALMSWTVS
ncbi:hypothetical protein A7K91_13405 [Paenibacillus oryzae]|uniref:Uncharacterized protein n=1 Tax=Paenibacillus oryzae TaxID=1844972 RepID=A0A1A5YJ43_9BACL|nr:hypothetical protein A7K91_13405 [Paenibacillus oryzae]